MTDDLTPSIGLLADVGLSPKALVELAQEAEQAGFRSAWVVEYEYDSLAYNQALLMGTSRLTVGSSIARSTAHSPLHLAKNAAVIDQLAPGRYVLGIGAGPLRRLNESAERWGTGRDRTVGRMREYLEVVRRALTQPEFEYQGEFFSYEKVTLRVRPAGRVPIYLAAGGPQMAAVAGRLADGAFVMGFDTGVHRTRQLMHEAAVGAGRDPNVLKVASLIPTCVNEDEERARLALRAYLFDYYFHLPHRQQVLAQDGFEEAAEALRAIGTRGDTKRSVDEILADPASRAGAEAIPDAMLDACAIFGTPEQCRAKLPRVAASRGIDLPILYAFPAHGDWGAGYRATIAAFSTALVSGARTVARQHTDLGGRPGS